jgi:tryptophan 7-halogenase
MTAMDKMRNILVLGSGSAGLIAALTLKRKMPQLSIRIVRSPEIGVMAAVSGPS